MARGEDEDEAWDNRYEVIDRRVSGSALGVGVEACPSWGVRVSANVLRNVALPCRNSNRGSRITHASMGLYAPIRMQMWRRERLCDALAFEYFPGKIDWLRSKDAVRSQSQEHRPKAGCQRRR